MPALDPSTRWFAGSRHGGQRFRTTGRIPPLSEARFQLVNENGSIPVRPVGVGSHRRELPIGSDVVDFPG